jgi:dihydroorotate dehydrogenase (fumarate)
MDLTTTYLGLKLAHPLMPGASPLVDDLDTVRRLEDAGAAAIVMHSLFEEQVRGEYEIALREEEARSFVSLESGSHFPPIDPFTLDPDRYLNQVRRIKASVAVPVIGSLNGTTPGGWVESARLIEQAGADALELNVYFLATDLEETGAEVETRVLDLVHTVRQAVRIPLAVKLSRFYSSFANLAVELDARGADGLVLFNRFYQPDIDIERLEAMPTLRLSEPGELLPRLRWTAILSGRVRASIAITGGVHSAHDAVKAIMAGAHAVQIVSALLRHGPDHLRVVKEGLVAWLQDHGYESVAQMRGSMGLQTCPDPAAYERANYLRVLTSWRPGGRRVPHPSTRREAAEPLDEGI